MAIQILQRQQNTGFIGWTSLLPLDSTEWLQSDKLRTMATFVSYEIYNYIRSRATYCAVDIHTKLYIKPKNEIFA